MTAFTESNKPGIHKVVKQQTQKEISADLLAKRLLDLEGLEDEKKEFNDNYKKRKKELDTEVKTVSAIIRNYTPLFDEVDTETGEVK